MSAKHRATLEVTKLERRETTVNTEYVIVTAEKWDTRLTFEIPMRKAKSYPIGRKIDLNTKTQ